MKSCEYGLEVVWQTDGMAVGGRNKKGGSPTFAGSFGVSPDPFHPIFEHPVHSRRRSRTIAHLDLTSRP